MKGKVLASVLTLSIAASLVCGCGSQATETVAEDKTSDSTGAVTEAKTEEKTSETKSEEKTSETTESVPITVWGWDQSFNGVSFEEADALDDSVTVDFQEMGKADCLQKIHTVLASGVTDDLPDIVIISDAAAQGYLMSYPGSFLPMDDYLNYNDFASYKKDYVSYDGVGYGVPFDTGVAGLFYRTDYIEEAGYTEDDMQNLTWDEYAELGKKLAANGHMLQTFNPNDVSNFQILLQSCGQWYTDDQGQAKFVDNEALHECYRLFKEFNESDFVKVVSDWSEFQGAINGGDVACVIRGSWIASTIKAGADQSGLWKLAPIPVLEGINGATNKSNQGGSSFYVLANAKNADAAAQFLANTFGGNTDLYNTLAKNANIMGTYLPASSVEAYSTGDDYFSGQEVNKILAGWIAEIPAVNPGAYTAEAQAALLAVTPEILNGGDIDSLLSTAEEQFDQSIQ